MGKAALQPSETDKNIDTSKLDLTDKRKVDNDATLKCNCDVEIDPTNDDENSSTESVEANLQNIEDKDDSDASSSEVSWEPHPENFGGVKKLCNFCANYECPKIVRKFGSFKKPFLNINITFWQEIS
jgi:hypothetical protein